MDNRQDKKELRDETLENFARLNKSKKKFKHLILIPIVIAAIIIFITVCFAFFFKVKTIEVEGAAKYDPNLIIIKSGITAGENLYSYHEDNIEEILMLNYPYISKVELRRRWPDKIILKVFEESAGYCTEIYGETLILSSSLRILENPDINVDSIELCRLYLPDIDRALVGNKPVFCSDSNYIEKALSIIDASDIAESISAISLENKFAISFLIGNTYKIKCGNSDDLALKLTMTEKILQSSQLPAGVKAEIDVSNPSECSAILGESANLEL